MKMNNNNLGSNASSGVDGAEPAGETPAPASHTPGPWFAVWDEEDGWNHHVYSSPTDRVCFMAHGGPEKQAEFNANVRLIAAAPDLLSAAKTLMADLHARIELAPVNAKPVFRGIAELHDAINKAER